MLPGSSELFIIKRNAALEKVKEKVPDHVKPVIDLALSRKPSLVVDASLANALPEKLQQEGSKIGWTGSKEAFADAQEAYLSTGSLAVSKEAFIQSGGIVADSTDPKFLPGREIIYVVLLDGVPIKEIPAERLQYLLSRNIYNYTIVEKDAYVAASQAGTGMTAADVYNSRKG